MRHGSTLALVASCWLVVAVGSGGAEAGQGPGSEPEGAWTLPDVSQGHQIAPILLLSRPDVQKDLHLKEDQVAEAARAIADIHRKAAALKGQADGPAVVELRRSIDEEEKVWLETKLTEDQVGRLTEIDLRWEGIAAVATRTSVAKSLSISDAQKATLDRLVAERKAHKAKAPDRERDPNAAERHFTQQVMMTLSDGQRKRWEKMLGRPFAVTAATSGRSIR